MTIDQLFEALAALIYSASLVVCFGVGVIAGNQR